MSNWKPPSPVDPAYEAFPAHADPAIFGQFIDWLRQGRKINAD